MKKRNNMFRVITIIAVLLVTALVFSACGSSPSMPTSSTTAETTTDEETDASIESDENADYINLDVLKEIEANDTFEVKVTNKEIKKDYFDDFSFGEGSDAFLFTVTNNSDQEIMCVTVFALAYNKDQEMIKLGHSGGISSYTNGQDRYVIMLSTAEDSVIAAGQSEDGVYRCYLTDEEVAGIQAIVYSYKTADGEEHVNDSALDWYHDRKAGNSVAFD